MRGVTIKTKGVSFNLEDPDQLELYQFAAKRKNFSAYIKRLIQKDITGSWRTGANEVHPNQDESELLFDEGLMSKLI